MGPSRRKAGVHTPKLVALKTIQEKRAYSHDINLHSYPHINRKVILERGGGTETGKEFFFSNTTNN